MSKTTFNGHEGIWRTIKGTKVFIRDGQPLGEALKAAGITSKKPSGTSKSKKTSPDKTKSETPSEKLKRYQAEHKEAVKKMLANGVDTPEGKIFEKQARALETKIKELHKTVKKEEPEATFEQQLEIDTKAYSAAVKKMLEYEKGSDEYKKFEQLAKDATATMFKSQQLVNAQKAELAKLAEAADKGSWQGGEGGKEHWVPKGKTLEQVLKEKSPEYLNEMAKKKFEAQQDLLPKGEYEVDRIGPHEIYREKGQSLDDAVKEAYRSRGAFDERVSGSKLVDNRDIDVFKEKPIEGGFMPMQATAATHIIDTGFGAELKGKWFRYSDNAAKNEMVAAIDKDPKIRQAGLAYMYHQYKDLPEEYFENGTRLDYETFLNTPLQLYRGTSTERQRSKDSDVILSYSMTVETAGFFTSWHQGPGKEIEVISVKPKDILGVYDDGGEYEVWVRQKGKK